MTPLVLPAAGRDGAERPVQVWNSHTRGIDQGEEAADWISRFISRERPGRYRVVRMADDEQRMANVGEATLAFADAYPFLILSMASLQDLNARLPAPLPMNRFRPNIVLDGCAAYAEDHFDHLAVGGLDFFGMPLCLRCVITTTDQDTAERSKEPLRTLATYRRAPGGVTFGRNFNHAGTGMVRVGDRVDVRQTATPRV